MRKPTLHYYQNLGKNHNLSFKPRFSQSGSKPRFSKKCDEKKAGFVLNTVFVSQIINCVTKKSNVSNSKCVISFTHL